MTAAARLKPVLRRLVFVHTIDVVGRSTVQPPPPIPHAPDLVLHRLTTLDDVLVRAPGERVAALPALLRPALSPLLQRRRERRTAERLRRGDVAYVATRDDQVAAWVWASRSTSFRCRWSGLRFHLQPDEAYLYDLWSFPAHRTSGAGAFVMHGALEDLHDSGQVVKAYGYVLRDNRANQLLTRVVFGFEQVQRVKDLRVLSRLAWQLPFTDTPPDGPCSSPRAARHRVENSPRADVTTTPGTTRERPPQEQCR